MRSIPLLLGKVNPLHTAHTENNTPPTSDDGARLLEHSDVELARCRDAVKAQNTLPRFVFKMHEALRQLAAHFMDSCLLIAEHADAQLFLEERGECFLHNTSTLTARNFELLPLARRSVPKRGDLTLELDALRAHGRDASVKAHDLCSRFSERTLLRR